MSPAQNKERKKDWKTECCEPKYRRKKKMKNTNPTQHRTKDGRRETKQGENMIQIIVLNIAKCNYINETATAQAWAWARLPTMQPSLRNIPIYLVFLSFSLWMHQKPFPCIFVSNRFVSMRPKFIQFGTHLSIFTLLMSGTMAPG